MTNVVKGSSNHGDDWMSRHVHCISVATLLTSGAASFVAGTMMRTCGAACLTRETACATSKVGLQIGEIIRQAAAVVLQVRGNDFPAAKAAAKHRKAVLQGCCIILLI
ncbi:MAG TPA: hypothetical protein VGZ24_03150 [Chthoniobacterales bacterium]|nr:hypothetical protein [Chthoniobacterales bacterium]